MGTNVINSPMSPSPQYMVPPNLMSDLKFLRLGGGKNDATLGIKRVNNNLFKYFFSEHKFCIWLRRGMFQARERNLPASLHKYGSCRSLIQVKIHQKYYKFSEKILENFHKNPQKICKNLPFLIKLNKNSEFGDLLMDYLVILLSV